MDRREFPSAGALAPVLPAACRVTHVPGAVPPATTGRDGCLKFDSDVPGLEPKVFAKNSLYGDNAYPGYQTLNEAGEEFYYAVTGREWQGSRIRHISAKNSLKIDTLLPTNDKGEGEPFITYNGARMFYMAIMPPTDHPWQSDIYYLDNTAGGWSALQLLPPPVNTFSSDDLPRNLRHLTVSEILEVV